MKHLLTIFATCFILQQGIAQSTVAFTDPRDGQVYKTISFTSDSTGVTYNWMAQNLSYKIAGTYAYSDTMGIEKDLGLLYTWDAAMKACPTGWHLPTDSEWTILIHQFGGTEKAAASLKSASGWDEGGNGTNRSGFNGLPGGLLRDDGNGIVLVGKFGFWWTSSPTGQDEAAWEWNMHFRYPSKIFRFPAQHGALSVRCVRNLPDSSGFIH